MLEIYLRPYYKQCIHQLWYNFACKASNNYSPVLVFHCLPVHVRYYFLSYDDDIILYSKLLLQTRQPHALFLLCLLLLFFIVYTCVSLSDFVLFMTWLLALRRGERRRGKFFGTCKVRDGRRLFWDGRKAVKVACMVQYITLGVSWIREKRVSTYYSTLYRLYCIGNAKVFLPARFPNKDDSGSFKTAVVPTVVRFY